MQIGDNCRHLLLTQLLKLTEDTGLEEDLGVTDTVVVAEVQGGENLLRGNLAVDETGWDCVGSEDRITKNERKNIM